MTPSIVECEVCQVRARKTTQNSGKGRLSGMRPRARRARDTLRVAAWSERFFCARKLATVPCRALEIACDSQVVRAHANIPAPCVCVCVCVCVYLRECASCARVTPQGAVVLTLPF